MICEYEKGLPGREIFGDTLCRLWGRTRTAVAAFFLAPCCWADGDDPFFVTYTSQMEDLGELEIETKNVTGKPGGGRRFLGSVLEFEYGSTSWWTTEFYLNGQITANENTVFTGYRWENRFRLLHEKHWINPVLYLEFENVNAADKSLLTVVGHEGIGDLKVPTDKARRELEREIEGKLILDSSFKGWTIAENLIFEKDVRHGPYEFGYAIGLYRAIGGAATNSSFGLQSTSHYLAPVVSWALSHGVMLKFSPNFGLTDTSAGFLMRFGASAEVEDFGGAIAKLFRGRRR